MDKQIRKMKKTMVRISAYLAVKKVRACLMGALIIDFIQRVVMHYPLTGLYVLLLNAVLPFIIELMMQGKVKETKEEELPILQEVHGYNKIQYYAQMMTAVLSLGCLWAWQKNTGVVASMPLQLRVGPKYMFLAYIVGLMVLALGNLKKLKQQLEGNKL